MKQIILVSILSAFVGLGVGFFVSKNNDEYQFFYIYSGTAAFITSALLWYLFVYTQTNSGSLRGAIVNGFSGLLAHYVCWYLYIAFVSIQYYITGQPVSSLGEPPMGLLHGIWGASVFSFFSLLAFGWVTIPLGAMIGWLTIQLSNH
jgi:hypothetical protein